MISNAKRQLVFNTAIKPIFTHRGILCIDIAKYLINRYGDKRNTSLTLNTILIKISKHEWTSSR